MVDVHLHTKFSFDSKEEPENYVNIARKTDVKVIGFSEHYDYDAYLDGEKDVELADLKAYSKEVVQLKKKYPDIKILQGVEFGYRKEAVAHYSEILNEFNFDYAINSLHTLPTRGDCYHDRFFEGKSLRDCYADYFKGVLESVNAGYNYQIIGHLGYACRYRRGQGARIIYGDFADILDEILKAVIRKDKCLEINTSCGTSGCEFLPDKDIIIRYLQLGGKLLSFGSDAHTAANYFKGADLLKQFLKQAGVKELFYYEKRLPVSYKI